MNPSHARSALVFAAVTVCFVLGCGRVKNTPEGAGDSETPAPTQADPLAGVPCAAWQPSDADWSSLATTRPAMLQGMSASPSGKYLYSVGSWWDAGALEQRIVRSADLGETWCVVSTPEPVTTVAPSPADETVLYALGAAQGSTAPQLLATNDGGASWVATALPDGATGDLATSFTDSNAVWLSRYDEVGGQKRYLSVDGGASWNAPIPPVFAVDLNSQGPVFVLGTVDGFLVDPSAGRRLLAWGEVSTYDTRISSSGFVDGPARWFSSDDAGDSWNELQAPPAPVARVVVDAAATLYLSGNAASFRSSDWAVTWQEVAPLPDGVAKVSTLGSSRAGRLFAWAMNAFNGPTTTVDAWRSSDAGATWQTLTVPTDTAIVPLLAPDGGDTLVGLGAAGLASTVNGGKSWHQLPLVPTARNVAESPIDGRLWANDMLGWAGLGDAGSSISGSTASLSSTDGGLTWAPGGAVSGPLFMDGASADRAFSGDFRSSGFSQRTEDGGQSWAVVARPAGDVNAVGNCAPPNSCMYLLIPQYNAAAGACALTATHDAGRTWSAQRPMPSKLCANAFSTLTVAADDPQHLLAGCGDALCESRDGGERWTSLPFPEQGRSVDSPLLLPDGVELVGTTATTQLPASPFALARSADGGSTWTDVLSLPDGLDIRLIQSVAQPSTVFAVCFISNSFDEVLRSDDAGLTWRVELPKVAAGAAGLYVQAIVDQPGGGFAAMTQYGLVRFE